MGKKPKRLETAITKAPVPLSSSDISRLRDLRDHGPAIRNAGGGWKVGGQNRRRDGMDRLALLGLALEVGEGRKARLYISEGGRACLAERWV